MSGTPRSTEAEVQQRVQAVYMLLLRRESRQNILRFASERWGVSERQAENYLSQARQLMRQELAHDREDARAEHVAIRKDLFNRLYKEEKWGAAFQVVQDEAKLLGLYFDLEDHVKATVSAGYAVYEPGEAEAQIEAEQEFEVEIGLAVPEEFADAWEGN